MRPRVKRFGVDPRRWVEYDDLPRDELATWTQASKVAEGGRWSSILLGAGVCSAVVESSRSASLYDRAVETEALDAAGQALFAQLKTESFGIALRSLRTTATTESALGLDSTLALERYKSVLHALTETVRSIHTPWHEIGAEALLQVKQGLTDYRWIFNTNYDLLLYWALRADLDGANDVDDTRDFFWTKSSPLVFNPSDTEVWQRNKTLPKVLYLHGGLHLCQLHDGTIMKRVAATDAAEDGSLLDRFGARIPRHPDATPLICEGTSTDRQTTVRTSDYLSFGAYQLGRSSSGPLVVLGEALTKRNDHLIRVLRDRAGTIAISMRREDHDDLERAKVTIRARLGRANIAFFDEQTHPLAKVRVSTG